MSDQHEFPRSLTQPARGCPLQAAPVPCAPGGCVTPSARPGTHSPLALRDAARFWWLFLDTAPRLVEAIAPRVETGLHHTHSISHSSSPGIRQGCPMRACFHAAPTINAPCCPAWPERCRATSRSASSPPRTDDGDHSHLLKAVSRPAPPSSCSRHPRSPVHQ